MATHFCGEYHVDTQLVLGHEKLDCGMPEMVDACDAPSSGETHISKSSCCDDVFQELNIENEFKPKAEKLNISLEFVSAYLFSALIVNPDNNELNPSFKFYLTPPIERDIPVLVQSFLL